MITFKDGKELKKGDLFRLEQLCDSIVPIDIYKSYEEKDNGVEFIDVMTSIRFGERSRSNMCLKSGDPRIELNNKIENIISEIDDCPLMFEYLGNGKCKETISNKTLNIYCNLDNECLSEKYLDFSDSDSISTFSEGLNDSLENSLAIKIGSYHDGEEILPIDDSFAKQNEEFKANSHDFVNNINLLSEISNELVKNDIENIVKPTLNNLDEIKASLNNGSRHV